ncbi:MAG: hypothetical protein JSS43_23620 [Proteobacteria bacterium]|nr:hypothetical protein [Pseudomonadota bacterium]
MIGRIGSVALLALVLAVPAVAAPVLADAPLPPDLATRLNEATPTRGMATALSLLEETRPVAEPGALFVGKRPVIVNVPPEPGYLSIGRASDAVAGHATNPDGAASATVRVGAFGVIESIPADDPAAAKQQAARAAAARRLAEVTQAPPGEGSPSSRMPDAGSAGAFRPNPQPAPEPSVPAGQSAPAAATRPAVGQGAGGSAAGAVSAPDPRRQPGVTPDVTGLASVQPAAALLPVESRTALRQPGAAWAGRAGAVGADFIRDLLTRNAEFPNGRAVPVRPLFDSFILSPRTAVQTLEVADPPPGPAVVALPLPIYTLPDAMVPGSLRIYGTGPPDVGMLAWWEIWLRDLRSLTGPQIASVLITMGALIGFVQLWRRRRRLE